MENFIVKWCMFLLRINASALTTTKKGATLQLTATIAPTDATDKAVSWKSINPNVRTIDENGLVKAVSTGTVLVYATANDGGKTATTTIRVTP